MRELATASGDAAITADQANIEVELADGRKLTKFVAQSLGNIHRPLSDRQLEDKFRDQAVPTLTTAQADALIDLCWRIDTLENVGTLVAASVPVAAPAPARTVVGA